MSCVSRGGLAIWRTGHMPGGPFSIGAVRGLLGPKIAPKCPKMPFRALKMHQSALKCLKNRLCGESHDAACDSPLRRFLRHFRALWCIFRALKGI